MNQSKESKNRRGPSLAKLFGHSPGSTKSKSRRDYARGLLSQQWNMGFPFCGQSGSTTWAHQEDGQGKESKLVDGPAHLPLKKLVKFDIDNPWLRTR